MEAGKTKIELLLSLKNKMKTGLTKAKNMLENKVGEMKKSLNSLKVASTKAKDMLGNKVGKMKKSINSLKTSHVKAFKAMRDEIPMFGRAMDLLGNPYVLITAGIIAITALFGKAVNEAGKFNHEFLQIKQLNLDKPAAELDKYKTKILDVSMKTGIAATDTAKAFYELQSGTGLYGDKVAKIAEKISVFSIATGTDLTTNTTQVTKAMKAFGLGVGDVDYLLVNNAKTVQGGLVTFKEFAKVQTEFAGAAAGAGQKIETANKLFAAFTSIASNSASAATMTKSAFDGLSQAQTLKGLKDFVKIYDSNDKMRDLSDILKDVSAKFKKMSPKAIDTLINKVGGPEGLRNMFVKLKTGSEDFFKTLEAYDSSKFDLDKALKNAMGDFVTLKGIVKNQFNTVMIKLGEKILPHVAKFLQKVSKVLNYAYKNFDKIIPILKIAAAVIGTVTVALIAMKIAAMFNPFVLIAAAVAALVTGFILLIQKFNNVREWFINSPKWVKILTVALAGPLLPLIALAGAIRYIIDNFEHIKVIASMSFAIMGQEFESANNRIISGIKMMWLQMKHFGQYMTGIFTNVGKAFFLAKMGDFSGAKKALKTEISTKASAEIDQLRKSREKQWLDSYTKMQKYNDRLQEAKSKMAWKKTTKKGGEETTDGETSGDFTSDQKKTTGGGSGLGAGIGAVTGSAKQIKNITINIDSFVKGGINTQNTELQHKSGDEMETWFREKMLRIMRGVETGYL